MGSDGGSAARLTTDPRLARPLAQLLRDAAVAASAAATVDGDVEDAPQLQSPPLPQSNEPTLPADVTTDAQVVQRLLDLLAHTDSELQRRTLECLCIASEYGMSPLVASPEQIS